MRVPTAGQKRCRGHKETLAAGIAMAAEWFGRRSYRFSRHRVTEGHKRHSEDSFAGQRPNRVYLRAAVMASTTSLTQRSRSSLITSTSNASR